MTDEIKKPIPRPKAQGKKKTGGRKKGSRNKTTAELKEWVFVFVNDNLSLFKAQFKTLPIQEQITIIMKLLPFVLPKQMESKISLDDDLAKTVKESMDKINNMFK